MRRSLANALAFCVSVFGGILAGIALTGAEVVEEKLQVAWTHLTDHR
jgi:hypothetical protein